MYICVLWICYIQRYGFCQTFFTVREYIQLLRKSKSIVRLLMVHTIDLFGNYVTTNTVFNLGPPQMGWISSLFLTGYCQRSRTSFFNKCIKKNFGFSPINVEIILNSKTRLNSHGCSASFSYLGLFPHLLVKIQNSFLCMCSRRMFCFSENSP